MILIQEHSQKTKLQVLKFKKKTELSAATKRNLATKPTPAPNQYEPFKFDNGMKGVGVVKIVKGAVRRKSDANLWLFMLI
jgi:hypothetical protein